MGQVWCVYCGWQLKVWIDIGCSFGGGGILLLGNNDCYYGVEVEILIFDDCWWLFVLVDWCLIDFQDQCIDFLWLGVGVCYCFGQLDVEVVVLCVNDYIGDIGLWVGVGWQFNDYWYVGLVVVCNDLEVLMQVCVVGIIVDSVSVQVDYWCSEFIYWVFGVSCFCYDDGNYCELFSISIE